MYRRATEKDARGAYAMGENQSRSRRMENVKLIWVISNGAFLLHYNEEYEKATLVYYSQTRTSLSQHTNTGAPHRKRADKRAFARRR